MLRISIFKKPVLMLILLIFSASLFAFPPSGLSQEDDEEWQKNWGIEEGFAIVKDSEGYSLPSAMVFVPNPGNGPKDPLYFVTELRGAIKVVTNDRTVLTFTENFFTNDPERGLDTWKDEFGLGSICLDPEHGYIFVTFAYRGPDDRLRNSIVRFETTPVTFSTQPTNLIDFKEIFSKFKTGASHQIGSCQVDDGLLYVTIGDSLNEEMLPIALDSLRGKVLRFTLDGDPVPENPYYLEDNPLSNVNYVWATGFRNPFALEVVNGRVFVADNGRNLDRFLEVLPGRDYLWNGSDWSLGAVADTVFSPGIGPAQLEFYPAGIGVLSEQFDDSFFIAMTGVQRRGIVNVHYDFDEYRVSKVPKIILRYIGPTDSYYNGIIPGIALGPDGLYFAPMVEAGGETGVVYRIYFDPENQHPYRPEDIKNPRTLLTTLECLSCHSRNGKGGTSAPVLDYAILIENLDRRLNSDDYLDILSQVDELETDPFFEQSYAREEVRSQVGFQRIRYWLYYHLLEPKFDNPGAQMPNLGLTKDQASILTDYLLTESSEDEVTNQPTNNQSSKVPVVAYDVEASESSNPLIRLLSPLIPIVGYRHLPIFFAGGLFIGAILVWLTYKIRYKRVEK